MTTKTRVVTMAAVLTVGACGGAPSEEVSQESAPLSAAAAPQGLTQLAYGDVTGLYESTGNLYWTKSGTNALGEQAASFMRMSKTNPPGDEVALYTAGAPGSYTFGNVVWALADTYYGYFSVTYDGRESGPRRPATSGSEIIRVPLAGGEAKVIATSPSLIGTRDLATDGTSLYWEDATGIRSTPLPDGGTVTTLAETVLTSHVGLDANSVYFEAGSLIESVPKAGGLRTLLVTAYANITTFYIDANGYIFWGEEGGAVHEQTLDTNSVFTFQNPIAGRNVISVGLDGTHTVWIDCAEPSNDDCQVRIYDPWDGTFTVPQPPSTGANHLQCDSTSEYWSDQTGIKRYVW